MGQWMGQRTMYKKAGKRYVGEVSWVGGRTMTKQEAGSEAGSSPALAPGQSGVIQSSSDWGRSPEVWKLLLRG